MRLQGLTEGAKLVIHHNEPNKRKIRDCSSVLGELAWIDPAQVHTLERTSLPSAIVEIQNPMAATQMVRRFPRTELRYDFL